MSIVKKLIPVTLFYLIVMITFYLPTDLAKQILLIDSVAFIIFLFILNHKANQDINKQEPDAFWFLLINLVAFSVIQLVLLYGLIGWVIV